MRTQTRLLWTITAILVGLGFLGAACFGGPTSDFPKSATGSDRGGQDGGAAGGDNANGSTGGTSVGGNSGGTSGSSMPGDNGGGMDAGVSDIDAGADDGGM